MKFTRNLLQMKKYKITVIKLLILRPSSLDLWTNGNSRTFDIGITQRRPYRDDLCVNFKPFLILLEKSINRWILSANHASASLYLHYHAHKRGLQIDSQQVDTMRAVSTTAFQSIIPWRNSITVSHQSLLVFLWHSGVLWAPSINSYEQISVYSSPYTISAYSLIFSFQ